MAIPLLPIVITLIPLLVIIFLVYRVAGKKAGIITGFIVALLFLSTLAVVLQKGTAPTTSKNMLHITEWRLSLPLTADISDAYYTLDDGEVYISTKQLDRLVGHIDGCTSGLHGLRYRLDTHNSSKLEKAQSGAEPDCIAEASADTEKIVALQKAIQAAVQAAVAD